MSSNLNKLYVDGFLTQWAFHRVQKTLESEFGRRS